MTSILKISFVFLLLTALAFNGCKNVSEDQNTVSLKVDRLLNTEATEERFSGTVSIGHKGELIFENAYGIADRNWNIPMETGYRFDIASLNKSMVGMLIMIATEEGRLSPDDKLTELLTGFTYTGSFDSEITIHQMLTHTSGLPDYDAVSAELSANEFTGLKRSRFTSEEYVDFISQLEPAGNAGGQFHYSNFAYHLLSIILEEKYQQSFGELIKEKIFDPLGMKDSFSTTDNEEVHEKVVNAYLLRDGKWELSPFIDLSLGRRVFSTSGDLFKWGAAFNEPVLVSQATLDLIKTNHLNSLSEDLSYGYGWVIYEEGESFRMGDLSIDQPYLIHGGSTDGFKSLLININNGEWVISILANSGNRTREMELGEQITKVLIHSKK